MMWRRDRARPSVMTLLVFLSLRGTSAAAMLQDTLTVLGIETSCDETAAAVLRLGPEGPRVLAERVASQTDEHAPFGGVVPEIAARAHVERLDRLIAAVMAEAGLAFSDLDGVAATAGPGLIGGVMVGLTTAKAICLAAGKPLLAVNHLEGHALSPRLSDHAPFPYLLLLVSGGHCQFLAVEEVGRYRRMGTTIDDAPGEAFDKTAKLLGLTGSGGPAVEAAAEGGRAEAIALPRPLLDRPGLDLSFSGLKTAVRRAWDEGDRTPGRQADICAAFQAAVTDCLGVKSSRALGDFAACYPDAGEKRFVVAGGVAANRAIRARLADVAAAQGFRFCAPPLRWCTDNAAMIALAGAERLVRGLCDDLDVAARPRWPLDGISIPAIGSGRKGPKA
jgi:N6-L-threonylcarbamoyladenine synthase